MVILLKWKSRKYLKEVLEGALGGLKTTLIVVTAVLIYLGTRIFLLFRKYPKTRYEWSMYGGSPPAEFLIKKTWLLTTAKVIKFGLFVLFLYYVVELLAYKKESTLYYLYELIKKGTKELKEEEL